MKLQSLLIIILLTISCNTINNEDVILKIGDYELTKNELIAKREHKSYKGLNSNDLEKKLIYEGRVLAYALHHKYDTISILNNLVEYASRAYVTRIDGFLWNKTVKPKLQVTENMIKEAYVKSANEFILDVIQIEDIDILDKYRPLENNFELLKEKFSTYGNVKIFTISSRFPHSSISAYIDDLDKSKVGDVLGPIHTEKGYILAHVMKIQSIKRNTFEKEREGLKTELTLTLRNQYIWENHKYILEKAKPIIFDKAVKDLTVKYNDQEKNWLGIDPNISLMDYHFEGEKKSFLVSDFTKFVANEPVFYGSLKEVVDVKKILISIIINKYKYAEAEHMNVQNDIDYQRFKKDYQQKIFLEHFKRSYIYSKISIQPNEIEDYYNKNNHDFKVFESANVSIYKFKDLQSALQGRKLLYQNLQSFINKDSVSIKLASLPQSTPAVISIIDKNNDIKLINSIVKLNSNQFSSPIEIKGNYFIAFINSTKGQTTLPIIYTMEHIEKILMVNKVNQLISKIDDELKYKYSIKLNKIKECL
jgi:hypothetical protein